MNEIFSRGMAAATRLTQAGKLGEATALLQKILRGDSSPSEPEPVAWQRLIEAPLIDASAVKTSKMDLRGFFDRTAPLAEPISPRVRKSRAETAPAGIGHAPGQFIPGSFSNNAGSRAYKLYIPAVRDGGARPLIVMLHGCMQSPDDFAAGTRMNACAEEHECFVVYPEQASSANASKCWNWFKSAEQVRGRGEPSIIAGLTREIIKNNAIDPHRVYIAGLSAGGAAAAIMGETYPELYTAVGVHSGLACGAARDMPSAIAVMSGHPQTRGAGPDRQSEMFVPTIVFHGDRDTTVHPRNGAEVIARAGELSNLQSMTENATAAGRPYTRSLYRNAQGRTVMEEWVIHGAGHAWSGGSKRGSFADAKGPDASREMLRFFLAQRI